MHSDVDKYYKWAKNYVKYEVFNGETEVFVAFHRRTLSPVFVDDVNDG